MLLLVVFLGGGFVCLFLPEPSEAFMIENLLFSVMGPQVSHSCEADVCRLFLYKELFKEIQKAFK